jgi:hypothetical protein
MPTAAWGGIYNPCEADEGPRIPEWSLRGLGFKSTFLTYRSLGAGDTGLEFDNPTRRRYQLIERLGQANLSRLTLLEKLGLSEYLIRRGDPEGARQVLKPIMTAAESSPVNFLFFSNMATACQMIAGSSGGSGAFVEYSEAIYHMKTALKMWPETWDGLVDRSMISLALGSAGPGDPGNLSMVPTLAMSGESQRMLFNLRWDHDSESSTFYRCRTAETYYLKLLESRFNEEKQIRIKENVIAATKDKAEKKKLEKELKELRRTRTVDNDALFTDGKRSIRYVDEKGEFAPGKLADKERDLLPDRKVDKAILIVQQLLFWLPGDPRLYRQLGELYNARGRASDLIAAREIFMDLVETQGKTENDDLRRRTTELKEFKIPLEKTSDADFNEIEHLRDRIQELEDQIVELNRRPPGVLSENPPVNWQTIGITFIFGASVGLVGLWQVQEILRRSRRNKPV